jgi:hypothetical protein
VKRPACRGLRLPGVAQVWSVVLVVTFGDRDRELLSQPVRLIDQSAGSGRLGIPTRECAWSQRRIGLWAAAGSTRVSCSSRSGSGTVSVA